MKKYREYLHSIISVENNKGMSIKEFVREGVPSEIVLKTIKEEEMICLSSAVTKRDGWNACLLVEIMMKSSEQCPAQFFL